MVMIGCVNFVILEKALVKVKVPVHLDSGKTVMGYRYKKTGELPALFRKRKNHSLDLPFELPECGVNFEI